MDMIFYIMYTDTIKGGEMMEEKKIDRRNAWQLEHQERVIIMTDRQSSPTKDQIKAAAARSGQSVNQWVLDAIRDKI